MRIIVFGLGMLGSKLFEVAVEQGYDVYGTARRPDNFPPSLFPRERIVRFEIRKNDIGKILDRIKPTAIINCIGIVPSVKVSDEDIMRINGKFPRELARACTARNIRMIQMSTDCVFSGERGNYGEEDMPDPNYAYGRSKAEGEILDKPHLTIRTSFVGVEKSARHGLLSWFLSNPEGSTIKGYTNAIWSGLTTRALTPILLNLAGGRETGLLHVAGEKISKYDLLHLFKKHLKHNVTIVPYDKFTCDRSLRHDRLDELGITVLPVEEMVRELAEKDL